MIKTALSFSFNEVKNQSELNQIRKNGINQAFIRTIYTKTIVESTYDSIVSKLSRCSLKKNTYKLHELACQKTIQILNSKNL